MKHLDLSVVIPAYDEMANLQKGVLVKVHDFLSHADLSYEVILVDDGSKDGSDEFIDSFCKRHEHFMLIRNNHTGKAGAVTTGVLASAGEIVLFADMDQATPIEELDKLLPYFQDGYDVVIGSRRTKRTGSPLTRRMISLAAIVLRKVIIGMSDISDTQCGFKAFKKDAAKQLFTKIKTLHHGYKSISGSAVKAGFDIELLYLAKKNGFRIKEVPVKWLHVETRRVNPIRDSIDGVVDLIHIKQNDLQGKYSSL